MSHKNDTISCTECGEIENKAYNDRMEQEPTVTCLGKFIDDTLCTAAIIRTTPDGCEMLTDQEILVMLSFSLDSIGRATYGDDFKPVTNALIVAMSEVGISMRLPDDD